MSLKYLPACFLFLLPFFFIESGCEGPRFDPNGYRCENKFHCLHAQGFVCIKGVCTYQAPKKSETSKENTGESTPEAKQDGGEHIQEKSSVEKAPTPESLPSEKSPVESSTSEQAVDASSAD